MSARSCWPSASICSAWLKPSSCAARSPLFTAAPLPPFCSRRSSVPRPGLAMLVDRGAPLGRCRHPRPRRRPVRADRATTRRWSSGCRRSGSARRGATATVMTRARSQGSSSIETRTPELPRRSAAQLERDLVACPAQQLELDHVVGLDRLAELEAVTRRSAGARASSARTRARRAVQLDHAGQDRQVVEVAAEEMPVGGDGRAAIVFVVPSSNIRAFRLRTAPAARAPTSLPLSSRGSAATNRKRRGQRDRLQAALSSAARSAATQAGRDDRAHSSCAAAAACRPAPPPRRRRRGSRAAGARSAATATRLPPILTTPSARPSSSKRPSGRSAIRSAPRYQPLGVAVGASTNGRAQRASPSSSSRATYAGERLQRVITPAAALAPGDPAGLRRAEHLGHRDARQLRVTPTPVGRVQRRARREDPGQRGQGAAATASRALQVRGNAAPARSTARRRAWAAIVSACSGVARTKLPPPMRGPGPRTAGRRGGAAARWPARASPGPRPHRLHQQLRLAEQLRGALAAGDVRARRSGGMDADQRALGRERQGRSVPSAARATPARSRVRTSTRPPPRRRRRAGSARCRARRTGDRWSPCGCWAEAPPAAPCSRPPAAPPRTGSGPRRPPSPPAPC